MRFVRLRRTACGLSEPLLPALLNVRTSRVSGMNATKALDPKRKLALLASDGDRYTMVIWWCTDCRSPLCQPPLALMPCGVLPTCARTPSCPWGASWQSVRACVTASWHGEAPVMHVPAIARLWRQPCPRPSWSSPWWAVPPNAAPTSARRARMPCMCCFRLNAHTVTGHGQLGGASSHGQLACDNKCLQQKLPFLWACRGTAHECLRTRRPATWLASPTRVGERAEHGRRGLSTWSGLVCGVAAPHLLLGAFLLARRCTGGDGLHVAACVYMLCGCSIASLDASANVTAVCVCARARVRLHEPGASSPPPGWGMQMR